jgi:hypothetical protein
MAFENTMAAEYDYYKLFDEETEKGKVLDDDWSQSRWENETPTTDTLTDSEADKRRAYSITIKKLLREYRRKTPPKVTSLEELLCHRVVAPCLEFKSPTSVSARSKTNESKALRKYPPEIHEWVGFANDVTEYKAPVERELDSDRFEILRESLLWVERPLTDELSEQSNLLYNLQKLEECGIVGEVRKGDVGCTGLVDFTLRKGGDPSSDRVTVICESKSTHNLLLPLCAELCVKKYNDAYKKVYGAKDTQEEGTYPPAEQYEEKHNEAYDNAVDKQEEGTHSGDEQYEEKGNEADDNTVDAQEESTHPPAWSMVCHPLGQLFGYLLDNKCPFGALTSGTRTYFVSISGGYIKISDAWFVGQQDYLRAWAYVHSLGCVESEWKQPTSWKKLTNENPTPLCWGKQQNQENQGTTNDTKPGKRPSNNSSQGSSNGQTADIASLALPNISCNDIAIGDVIGDGRNGSCFKVVWNGQTFAMKQFDIGKLGDAPYRKEISAYIRLQDAWGKLVPKPIFLSESPSGGVKFLGLQLGRMPNEFDDLAGWDQILRSLKQEYGIRHNDAEERNMIFIADSVTGVERMVAIDLEDWDDVTKARYLRKQ